jgi:polyhydroxyalkanoate synthase subunit PhaC
MMGAMESLEHSVGLRELYEQLRRTWLPPGLAGRAARMPVGSTPHNVVWRENKLQLIRYDTGVTARHPLPILLVPSLINRHYIFDLLPGKSIAEFLSNAGFAVYAIDWGAPSDEDRLLSIDRYLGGYLPRAMRVAARNVGADQVVLLGYCLGGTMAAIAAALKPERVHSLIALTTPIDFVDSGLLSAWARSPALDLKTLVAALGNVPWSLLQLSFQMLRPTLGINKAKGLIERIWDDAFVDGVLALETWGNDNVAFPGECYREFIEQLYRGNALRQGTLRVNGARVDLGRIACPVLNVAAQYDNIVPRPSSHALNELVASRDTTELVVPGGHIGAVVSRRAMEQVWPAVQAWILERMLQR